MDEEFILFCTCPCSGLGWIHRPVTFENSRGFGMQLNKMLVDQIGGVIRIERGNGTKFLIKFEPGNE
jgi:two-component sensor histidine kinase